MKGATMEKESLFQSCEENKTPADVAAAIGAIDDIILNKFTKTVFRDLLTGLKILIKSIQQKDLEANTIILQWLKLYLRVENALDASDDKLREQFEKYIPATISYIVAALQYKPTDTPQYHMQLLDLSLKLLEKASEKTLKKVANLESGLIACLWLPIDFVGDFNTQMAALRLMVQLLKCIDDTKQDKELNKICTPQQRVLRDSICGAVQVANFHAGKFEKAARELLNNYNMNLAPNVLVYSMRCKTIKFGGNGAFYKPLNADYLWIDLNYCPRTLTFNARYRSSNKEEYVDVGVTLQIQKLALFKKMLHVVTNAPPHFSNNITNQNKFKTLRSLQFELYTDEVLRLKENHLVLDFYNAAANKESNMDSKTIKTPSTSSDTTSEQSLRLSPPKNVAAGKDFPEDTIATTDHVEQPPLLQVEQKEQTNRTMENFQKSYHFLIGHSEEILELKSSSDNLSIQNKEVSTIADPKNQRLDPKESTTVHSLKSNAHNIDPVDPTIFKSPESNKGFKIPSLPFYENARLRAKLSQQSNKATSQPSPIRKTISNIQIPPPTVEETPKSSLTHDDVPRNISQRKEQPVKKPTLSTGGDGKRRFFTGHNQPCDICTSPGAKKPKIIKSSAKKRVNKYEKIFTSPPKRKQINKVKPMNHLAKSDGDPEEAVQEYVENGGIVNITNFLRNGNESAAVFNEDERRIILQNVQRINENLERTAKKFFHKTEKDPATTTDNFIEDIYDQRNVSEAEPGQSYRNFRVRRRIEETCVEKSKPKTTRRRKNVTKSKKIPKNQTSDSKKENAKNIANTTKSSEVPKTKRTATKRKAIATVSTAAKVTTEPKATASLSPKHSNRVQNKTIYSQDMQIDLTCLGNDIGKQKTKTNSISSQNQVRESTKSLSTLEPPTKKVKTSKDVNEREKSTVITHLPKADVDNNKNITKKSHNKNLTTLSPMTISDSSFNLNDIQRVRHNATVDELIADENIWLSPTIRCYNELHSPNLSDAMNVSDFADAAPEILKDKHSKNDSSCIKSLFPNISNFNNTISNKFQHEELTREISKHPTEQCILYHERSDDESSESGDDELSVQRTSSALLEEIHLTPNKVSVEHSFATKSVTRSTRKSISGAQPKLQTCEVRTTSVTTRQIISQDLFFGPTTSAETSKLSHEAQCRKSAEELEESNATMLIPKLPAFNDMSHCMMPYNNICQELEVAHNPLFKDIFIILETFKENMKKEYNNFHSRLKLDAFVEKVTDVSKRLLVEAENERLDMQQSEKEITKIMRQLNWHWETYQKKTERFKCFKQNIESYLKALSEIDFESDINKEYEEFLAKLRNNGIQLSTKLWQQFVKDTTDNLINNLSTFSTL